MVFVNLEGRQIVRSKPGKVKQSVNTRRAAGVFGYVSKKDAAYRRALMRIWKFTTDPSYACRHRSALYGMAGSVRVNGTETVSLLQGNPKVMENFNFNSSLQWSRVCAFFPEVVLNEAEEKLIVVLPEVRWKKEIRPPRKMSSARITFLCISVQPAEDDSHIVKLLARWQYDITPHNSLNAKENTVEGVPAGRTIFLLAEIQFTPEGAQAVSPLLRTAGA